MSFSTQSKFVIAVVALTATGNALTLSTSTMFFLSKGLSFTQLGVLDSVLLVFGLLLELPTGIVADRYGHRISFFLSLAIRSAYFTFLYLTNSFATIIALFILAALADALWSGSFITWYLEKRQVETGNENHVKEIGNLNAFTSGVSIIAGLTGSLLSSFSFGLAFGMASVALGLAAICTLFLSDPHLPGEETKKTTRLIINESVEYIRSCPRWVWLLILAQSIAYISISGVDNLWQPIIKMSSSAEGYWILGLTWIAVKAGTLVAGLLSSRFSSPGGVNVQLVVPTFICSAALGLLSTTSADWIMMVMFATHATFWVIYTNASNGVLFATFPSNSRASLYSFISMITSATGIAGLLTLGLVADWNIRGAIQVGAGILLIVGLFSVRSVRTRRIHEVRVESL